MRMSHLALLPDPLAVTVSPIMEHEYYTEGPVIDSLGRLYYTDLQGGKVWKNDGGRSIVWATGLTPNGQAILENGHHLICDSRRSCVLEYGVHGGERSVFVEGKIDHLKIQCPNDIIIDQLNGIYFTDSIRKNGAVFFVGFDGRKKVVADQVDFANGLVLLPDRSALLVAESYQNRILKIELMGPGLPKGTPEVFCNLPVNPNRVETGNLPDGLTLDATGRLWVAHYGMGALQVISPEGELLVTYATEIPLTSNVCFWKDSVVVTGGFDEPGPGRVVKLDFSGIPVKDQ